MSRESSPRKPAPVAGPSISDQLRREIRDCGLSGYALAELADVARPMISRFVAGDRSLSLETVDKLARALRLQLAPNGRRAKAK